MVGAMVVVVDAVVDGLTVVDDSVEAAVTASFDDDPPLPISTPTTAASKAIAAITATGINHEGRFFAAVLPAAAAAGAPAAAAPHDPQKFPVSGTPQEAH